MKVAIVDFGMGNLRSVANALEFVGVEPYLARRGEELEPAGAILLPGVGAFGAGIGNIHAAGLAEPLLRLVTEKGRPLLGICLGMQLLADSSEEYGSHRGLGLVPGRVRRLQPDDPACKIPHIGWNDLEIHRREPLFAEIGENPDYYFVHSWHLVPEEEAHCAAVCEHGQRFAAAVVHDQVAGVQFHPEKSQRAGIQLLRNFCEFARRC